MKPETASENMEHGSSEHPARTFLILMVTLLLVAMVQSSALRRDAVQIRLPVFRDICLFALDGILEGLAATPAGDLLRSKDRFFGQVEVVVWGDPSVPLLGASSSFTEKTVAIEVAASAKEGNHSNPQTDGQAESVSPPKDSQPGDPSAPPVTDPTKPKMVLLVGDSLMGGLAWGLTGEIGKEANFKIRNISKQNSGLAYPSFFNWPRKLQNEIERSKPDLVLMMIGANDYWDMPNSKRYAKFGTPEWEEHYASQIQEIIRICREHATKLVWVGIPVVRKPHLDKKYKVLNTLYEKECVRAGVRFVPTRDLFTTSEGEFSSFLEDELGRKVKARSSDGIHFSIFGCRLLACHVLAEGCNISSQKCEDRLKHAQN